MWNMQCFTIFFFILHFLNISIAQPAPRHPIFDHHYVQTSRGECYSNEEGNKSIPQRCVPDFINAAFNLKVDVTNECGKNPLHPTKFYVQSSHQKINRYCDICSSFDSKYSHPAEYLTDFNYEKNETWWQSETMLEGIKYPYSVNLTLRLGKAFDITYVRLKFMSPRPESFRILKKTHKNDEWVPWVFYSGSCRSTYKLPEKAPVLPGNEAVAQCTREFSDISPLTGGNIAFPTLEGRPSAENFEESEILQDWVTATEIRISLDRMNTFGDEIFGDRRVLRSYYWAISDFAVGGRCKCNGHASQCVKSTGQGEQQLVCDCKHHTTGVDCQQCEPFYVDRPWRPATSTEANECLPCNCNSLSNRCFFDQKLYDETGHGGHCIDCAENTKGLHCEECAENYWRQPNSRGCVPCQCHTLGSVSKQCDASGQCECKPGVGGQYCDHCLNGFYDFSASGCQNCHCLLAGSLHNSSLCSSVTGACNCKVNVEGQRCDRCRPGYFELLEDNEFGCNSCFCFGHSSNCTSAQGFYAINISSHFTHDTDKWTAGSERRQKDVQRSITDQAIAITQIDNSPVYFQASSKFLGDQRFSYSHLITFKLHVQLTFIGISIRDLIIVGNVGGQNRELSLPITAQRNPTPLNRPQQYSFLIHANPRFEWYPRVSEIEFLSVLSNVTAIKIRGTYSRGDVGFLQDFNIESATQNVNPDSGVSRLRANWIEKCECLKGYTGQFCENCALGYRRVIPYGGRLSKCVQCSCNKHSNSCDVESGMCDCKHNTVGRYCERCLLGYYGNALLGTSDACQKCNCPNDGPCILFEDISQGDVANKNIVCTDCPEGQTGQRCEYCADEYFGDPLKNKPCQKCNCNDNVDPNSIGTCNSLTGECLRCIHHTIGFNCEMCMPGFYGDAKSSSLLSSSIMVAGLNKGCKACNCYSLGTISSSTLINASALLECRKTDGQCNCKPNVTGRQCDVCEPGFFNIMSGYGCESCLCDPLGTIDGGQKCDSNTGKCLCKEGVIGDKCDQCAETHYGFGNSKGCIKCMCNEDGAENLICDIRNGQCLCRDNVEGKLCNQCSENFYDLRGGCLPCDDCYSLIHERKNKIANSMDNLKDVLNDLATTPVLINDTDFNKIIADSRKQFDGLIAKVSKKIGKLDIEIATKQFKIIRNQLDDAWSLVTKSLNYSNDVIDDQLKQWNIEKDEVQKELLDAIKQIKTRGNSIVKDAEKQLQNGGKSDYRLSKLADKALQAAKTQEQNMRQVRLLGTKLSNLSKEALAEAHETAFGEINNSAKKLTELEICVTETTRLLNHTQKISFKLGTDTEHVYDRAVRFLSLAEDLSVNSFTTVVDDLYKKKVNVSLETKKVMENVKTVDETYANRLFEAEKIITETQLRLKNAKQEFKWTDQFLKNLSESYNHAFEAVENSKKIHQNLQSALQILNDIKKEKLFHGNINEFPKNLNNGALAQILKIEADLFKVNKKIVKIEDAIEKVEKNANYALSIATKTKDDFLVYAEDVRSVSFNTEELRKIVESALSKLSETERSIQKAEDVSHQQVETFSRNQDKIDLALKNAGLAQHIASTANKSSAKSEELLKVVAQRLDFIKPVNDSELEQLETLINQLEVEYANTGIESLVSNEAQRDAALEAERRQLKIDLNELINELTSLTEIRNALPKNCHNKIKLEQEGQ